MLSNKVHSIILSKNNFPDVRIDDVSLDNIIKWTNLKDVQASDNFVVILANRNYYKPFMNNCFHQIKYKILDGENPTVRFKL